MLGLSEQDLCGVSFLIPRQTDRMLGCPAEQQADGWRLSAWGEDLETQFGDAVAWQCCGSAVFYMYIEASFARPAVLSFLFIRAVPERSFPFLLFLSFLQ